MRTQAEAISLLDDQVAFFGENPTGRRAINSNGVGMFIHPQTKRRCIVGRFLLNPTYVTKQFSDSIDTVEKICAENNVVFEDLLKPEYRGYSVEFFVLLQRLHDYGEYWSSTGLSEIGQSAVRDIKTYIRRNYPTNKEDALYREAIAA